MIPLKYIYAVASLISLIPWIFMYFRRKDLRKEMVIMGVLVTTIGLFANLFLWTEDWWRPQTITGTRVGFEDIIFGFTQGGIAAIIYEELFKKKVYKYKTSHNLGALLFTILMLIVGLFLFKWLKFNSFTSTSLAMAFAGTGILIIRKDLIIDAILTGLSVMFGSIPFYLIAQYLSPTFIDKIWLNANLSGVRFLGIPMEDIVFYFLFGLLIGPFYLYWKGEKLRR